MFLLFYLCVCVNVSACYLSGDVEKRALDTLEVELQVVPDNLLWVLRTKFSSPGKVTSVFNHRTISPETDRQRMRMYATYVQVPAEAK